MQSAWVYWFWKTNEEHQRLELWLSDDIHFTTSINSQKLTTPLNGKTSFTAEDAELYTAFRDILNQVKLKQQAQFSVAINAAAYLMHSKSLATKSWLFKLIEVNPQQLQCGDFVEVKTTQFNLENNRAVYMILESEVEASTAILVSDKQQIDEHRIYTCGQVIKAHNDRFKKLMNPELIV